MRYKGSATAETMLTRAASLPGKLPLLFKNPHLHHRRQNYRRQILLHLPELPDL